MIYLDTSVALAHVFAEDKRPTDELWGEPLVASRLLQYELVNRVNARERRKQSLGAVESLLARVSLVELSPVVLKRALEPFPVQVRTLDAIHLATIDFIVNHGQRCELATYDLRMKAAAKAMKFTLYAV